METTTKNLTEVDQILSKPYRLIVHNDDFNTFNHVIDCLMSVCKHTQEQAEQNSHIIHFRGYSEVKYGDKETIEVMKEKLVFAGLSATMELNT